MRAIGFFMLALALAALAGETGPPSKKRPATRADAKVVAIR